MRSHTMKKRKISGAKVIFYLLAAGFFLSIAGCSTVEPPDSNMPWAQPAEWEKDRKIPGMP